MIRLLSFLALALFASSSLTSSRADSIEKTQIPPKVTVYYAETPIINYHFGVGAFSTQERAEALRARIEKLSSDKTFDVQSLALTEVNQNAELTAGDLVLTSLTERDAVAENLNLHQLAEQVKTTVTDSIEKDRKEKSPHNLLLAALYAGLETLGLIFILMGLAFIQRKGSNLIQSYRGSKIHSIKIRSYEILTAERITRLLIWGIAAFRTILVIFVIYAYIPLVLSLFPWTANLASKLFTYVMLPIHKIAHLLISYVPNLFFILVILLVGRYILKFTKLFFDEIESGQLKFDGFPIEWASPTYKLIRVVVIAFLFVAAFPYLPGSDSPAFKGVTVFLGLLFSIGSSTSIGNVTAGIILTYMRPFKVGDRVQISDTVGDVVEKTLLLTRIRTIKNVDVTIPNSMILSSHMVNFSSSAKTDGLILHSTVTIGYDAPWKTVHELLITAAANTRGLEKTPAPFVLQTSLDDFYVSYQINAYTKLPNQMAKIYSDLHENIQNSFNAGGVEIMSPHYASLRDGNEITIPSDARKSGYAAPKFEIRNE